MRRNEIDFNGIAIGFRVLHIDGGFFVISACYVTSTHNCTLIIDFVRFSKKKSSKPFECLWKIL